ncbi:MAG: ATP-dependent protease subunit HslV [Bacillota bacterium]|nr:MAG: HslU--HslV peptidase proteolytic subunit [Bacillota bacterium]
MLHGTTIVAVRRGNRGAMAGDGQVTLGQNTILKQTARKVRRIAGGQVVAGFAGAVADALTLFEKFEAKLEEHRGNLPRAAVAVAREWRTDRMLRHLEALLVVMDAQHLLVLSGSGEVIEPDDGIAAVGSGGPYALAAARALVRHTDLDPRTIAEESLRIAASICVYTNDHVTVEEVGGP